MSEKLEEIRRQIDALDDRIHDLLMERAELIVGVSEEKKNSNIPVVQPAREARMIRRLLKRHRGPLPEAAIVGIWRELVGAVSLLQTGIKVSVSAGEGQTFCWDMARVYFGTVLPMTRSSGAPVSITDVRDDKATFAVVPWPHDGEKTPWWPFLVNQEQNERMRVVVALPYGTSGEKLRDKALVVSKTDFSPSGDDRSFLALELDPAVSRTKIVEVLKSLDIETFGINSRSGAQTGLRSLHCVEVSGYFSDNDKKFANIIEKFNGQNAKCIALGGYPVPPVFR